MADKKDMKKTSRVQQAEKSKKRIYQAAVDLFSEKGFEETKITDICRKASCSVGAFYHYYPSKENILDETFRIADDDFRNWVLTDRDDLSGKKMILEYMVSYGDLILRTGLDYSKIFYSSKNKTFIKKGRPMQAVLTQLIDKSIREGKFHTDLSAEEVCERVFICSRGVVFHWCLHEGNFDLKSHLENILDNLISGMENQNSPYNP